MAYRSRYQCDDCGTTMEDIEAVCFDKFKNCKKCYAYATECWQFATACAGEDVVAPYLVAGLVTNSDKPRKAIKRRNNSTSTC